MLFAYIRNYSHVIGPLRTLQPINSCQEPINSLAGCHCQYMFFCLSWASAWQRPPNSIDSLSFGRKHPFIRPAWFVRHVVGTSNRFTPRHIVRGSTRLVCVSCHIDALAALFVGASVLDLRESSLPWSLTLLTR
jgi:hypothetical protein